MKQQEAIKNRNKIILLIILMVVVIAVGTYAWFTMSHVADTNTIKGKTNEDKINLYVSSKGGDAFEKTTVADIIQVSKADTSYLQPVSTADLRTFLCAPSTNGAAVVNFNEDTDGDLYYKGEVYLMAESTGSRKGKLDVYLDTSDGSMVVPTDNKEILNASRLGLLINDESPVIMSLSDEHNTGTAEQTTTYVDGEPLPDGYLITKESDKIVGVPDPAVSIDKYCFDPNAENVKLPESPVFSLELNKIYKLNVFFYLEGCDSDCTSDIETQEVELHLSFYGILNY